MVATEVAAHGHRDFGIQGTVILNPAPARFIDPLTLSKVDVLVPNETEAGVMAGVPTPGTVDEVIAAASAIEGPGAVIVTMGSQGAVVVEGSSFAHVPAPAVQAIDPTAAGDSFCAGLADGLVRGLSLVDAAEWAVLCGSVTVTRRGAQSSLPTREDVESMEASG